VLDCGDGAVQFSTDPRWALRLTGLDSVEVAWLVELGRRRHSSLAVTAARHGIADHRRDRIVEMLRASQFLQQHSRRAIPDSAASSPTADAPALGALRLDGAGYATLAKRAHASVAVTRLGRLGAAVAIQLATAGVGAIIVPDSGFVQTADLGLGGYAAADVGRPRREVLHEILARVAPRVTILADGCADVIVLVESHSASPDRALPLMGESVPHLAVTVQEAGAEVGPFVLPGKSPCLRCADLTRTTADPAWPTLASQFHPLPELPAEATLAASTAAVTAAQVIAFLDGLRPMTAGALVELDLPQLLPRIVMLRPHPSCGCTWFRRTRSPSAAQPPD
jgi:bacteriocin biosynthesis cyclodehydratase domain-containing protein